MPPSAAPAAACARPPPGRARVAAGPRRRGRRGRRRRSSPPPPPAARRGGRRSAGSTAGPRRTAFHTRYTNRSGITLRGPRSPPVPIAARVSPTRQVTGCEDPGSARSGAEPQTTDVAFTTLQHPLSRHRPENRLVTVPRCGEQCPSCGKPMATDQRYCLECGSRRGDPRLPFMDAVVFMEASKQPERPAAARRRCRPAGEPARGSPTTPRWSPVSPPWFSRSASAS